MPAKNTKYTSSEASQIIADYIDQSAVRLSQRLKKAYSEQKKHTARSHTQGLF